MVKRKDPPRVQPKKRGTSYGKFYALLGLIAVAAGAAIVMSNRSAPRQDSFVVDPGLPAVPAEGYVLGNPDAPVAVLQWADFECSACMSFATITEPDIKRRLVETGQISYHFFFFPLTEIHPAAAAAAYAAACAGEQDRFWEMHDALFNGHHEWALGRARDPRGVFRGYAQRIGLDVNAWSTCYDSDRHRERIVAHVAEGQRRGVTATPTFVIGNRVQPGAISYDRFKALVDSAMLARGAMPAGGTQPVPEKTQVDPSKQ